MWFQDGLIPPSDGREPRQTDHPHGRLATLKMGLLPAWVIGRSLAVSIDRDSAASLLVHEGSRHAPQRFSVSKVSAFRTPKHAAVAGAPRCFLGVRIRYRSHAAVVRLLASASFPTKQQRSRSSGHPASSRPHVLAIAATPRQFVEDTKSPPNTPLKLIGTALLVASPRCGDAAKPCQSAYGNVGVTCMPSRAW